MVGNYHVIDTLTKLNRDDKILTDTFLQLGEKDRSVILFLYEFGKPIPAGDLARQLSLPHSTINSVIKRLEDKGYVNWKEYHFVELNQTSAKMAAHHLQHHNIIHHYFVHYLDLEDDEAHVEGQKVAGVLSCKTVKQMKKLLDCDLEPCFVYVEKKE